MADGLMDAPQTALATIPQQMVYIQKASNGFIVTIGCKTLVSRTWKEMSAGLELYFKDPNKARRTYCTDEMEVARYARPQRLRHRARRSKKSKS